MGKTVRRAQQCDDVESIPLDEIYIPEKTLLKLHRDMAQIERMRADFESGRGVVRVVLRRRCGGGYNIEDGRHRVFAARLAGVSFIDAIIVG